MRNGLGRSREATRQEDPAAYIRMLERAHAFSDTLASEDISIMQKQLEEANAFEDNGQAILRIPGE